MAVATEGLDLTFNVSPNSAGIAQYTLVKLDTAGGSAFGDVINTTSNLDSALGIVQDSGGPATTLNGAEANNTAGMSVRVRCYGVSKAVAGAAVTRGDLLVTNASGQVITAPALAATDVRIIGVAFDAATALGDLITVYLTPFAVSLVNA